MSVESLILHLKERVLLGFISEIFSFYPLLPIIFLFDIRRLFFYDFLHHRNYFKTHLLPNGNYFHISLLTLNQLVIGDGENKIFINEIKVKEI